MKIHFLILIVVVLTMFALGCSESTAPQQTKPANTAASTPAATQATTPEQIQAPTPDPLVILDSKLGKEQYGGYIVTGTAIAQEELSYAEVDVKFYDSTGTVLQSGIANINNLKYGEKWSFKVYGPFEGRVANYTIKAGNSF